MNDYYVYGYYRLDTNELFYIGKGHNYRWKQIDSRNNHFKNIVNKSDVCVVIFIDNLSESEALMYEEQAIDQLVFEYGYSIDIVNNNSYVSGSHLVNRTWGGEGVSAPKTKTHKLKISRALMGQNHWAYGCKKSDIYKIKCMATKRQKARSVHCVTTDHVFSCIEEIRDVINETYYYGVQRCLLNKTYVYDNNVWEYVDEPLSEKKLLEIYDAMERKEQQEIDNYYIEEPKPYLGAHAHKYKEGNKKIKRIKCMELDIVFNSVAEANEFVGKPPSDDSIGSAARKNAKLDVPRYKSSKYTWIYV